MNAPESLDPPAALLDLPRRPGGHRIVIVGGGAAGLELAASLGRGLGRRGKAEVLLIDPALTHTWKPLLHELAAGTLRNSEASVDFLAQARRHHFHFHLGRMQALDRRRRQVHLAALVDAEGLEIAPPRAVDYDTLVLCVGSIVNDFGTPGVREHALRLDGADDARRLQQRLLAACARAEVRRSGPVRLVVVGGGATGVELAAELVDSAREIASYGQYLRQLPQPAQIRIVELGPRLLAALPEPVATQAQADLLRRGIEVRLNAKVEAVAAGHVRLAGGALVASDITVWCAGIQGPPVLERLDGLALTRSRQLPVRSTLQALGDDAIFALGDCASCGPADPGAKAPAVPPTAQAAHQQARFLAAALPRHLGGQPLPAFRFHERGALVSIGRSQAVGSLVEHLSGRRLALHGLFARWSYWVLQRQHMARLQGTGRMLLATLGGWLSGRAQSVVKLH